MNKKTKNIGFPASLTLIFVLLGLFGMNSAYAYVVPDNIVLENDRFSERLAKGIQYLEDTQGDILLEDMLDGRYDNQFQRFKKETLQMGYNKNPFWFKLTLTNNLAHHTTDTLTDRLYLSIRYPLLDSVKFYHVNIDHTQELITGDGLSFFDRYFSLNEFVFPISMYQGETNDIYIRVQSMNSLSVPMYLETERAFTENQHGYHIFNGIYLGLAAGLLLYNCFLWLGIRKPVYGFYALAILSIIAFNATIIGYTYRIWPEAIAFQQVAVYILSTFAAIATCWFGLVFLDAKKTQPRMFWFMIFITVLYSTALVSMFFVSTVLSSKINVLVTVSGVILFVSMAVRSIMQGRKSAAYYLIAQGAVLFSVIFTVLTSQGIIPLYYLAPEVLKWCSAFALLFFSFALANLVNEQRRLRELAQLESAKAQQQTLRAQIELNENLDKLVHERTTELEHANKLLRELNTKDELTGLRNRRYLNEVLPKEYKQAYRNRTEISILMMDIDFFKQINDNYGHQAGDNCLARAGAIISSILHRPSDFAVRYGGEEFVLVLPDTPLQGAIAVAEKIRKTFEKTHVPISNDETIPVTISIGVVSEVPEERDRHENLLRLADDLLYQAKENGRNRVEHHKAGNNPGFDQPQEA